MMDRATGRDGRDNTKFLYEKVLGKDPSLLISWTSTPGKDENGEHNWTTTLEVTLPTGNTQKYTGTSRRKGHSKDDASYQYLIANGYVVPYPIGEPPSP